MSLSLAGVVEPNPVTIKSGGWWPAKISESYAPALGTLNGGNEIFEKEGALHPEGAQPKLGFAIKSSSEKKLNQAITSLILD
ncbi:hypothetical protein A3850_016490 [Lewinella sp. 4G2]|nr:hypothetical protein A3850_016490 [Lewinella sp. 4G2]